MVTFELGNGIKILHVFLYRHKRETKTKNRWTQNKHEVLRQYVRP